MSGGSAAAGARRDAVSGAILPVFGIVWTVIVYQTVPVGRFGVGPRAFPPYLGGALVVLSALLLLSGLLGLRRHRMGGGAALAAQPDEDDSEGDGSAGAGVGPRLLLRILPGDCGIITAYGYPMQTAGFVIATALVVAGTLVLALGIRRPLLVVGMAVGITAGTWLGFGVVLGAYLPRGTWISLF